MQVQLHFLQVNIKPKTSISVTWIHFYTFKRTKTIGSTVISLDNKRKDNRRIKSGTVTWKFTYTNLVKFYIIFGEKMNIFPHLMSNVTALHGKARTLIFIYSDRVKNVEQLVGWAFFSIMHHFEIIERFPFPNENFLL